MIDDLRNVQTPQEEYKEGMKDLLPEFQWAAKKAESKVLFMVQPTVDEYKLHKARWVRPPFYSWHFNALIEGGFDNCSHCKFSVRWEELHVEYIRIQHRKWRETKLQPSKWPGLS